jgi:hypothetical protein
VHQRLTTILRPVLQVVLALLLAFTGIALARGQLSAPALSAAVSFIIATSVALDQLQRARRRHSFGSARPPAE